MTCSLDWVACIDVSVLLEENRTLYSDPFDRDLLPSLAAWNNLISPVRIKPVQEFYNQYWFDFLELTILPSLVAALVVWGTF